MIEESVADTYLEFLVRRQTVAPNQWRRLSLTEKLQQLEKLQLRTLEAYERRAVRGGAAIPTKWLRWKKAQSEHVLGNP